MPIRPENKHRYPADWRKVRGRILDRAGHRCEWCGVPNYAIGGRLSDGSCLTALGVPKPGEWAPCGNGSTTERLRIIRIVLTIAHLDHQPENCDRENLRALCQQCHIRYDEPMKAAGIRQRRLRAAELANEHSDMVPSERITQAAGVPTPCCRWRSTRSASNRINDTGGGRFLIISDRTSNRCLIGLF